MPELPEVETMRRGIAPVLGGRIRSARVPPCACRPLAMQPPRDALTRALRGRRIVRLDRAGKRVVLALDDEHRLVFEPRMTGLVLIADPPDRDHLRLCLELTDADASQLLFWDRRGLGVLSLLSPQEYEARLGGDRLGPDALDLPAEVYRARLAHSRRAIKVALLDQRAVAGIGNLYASEILHRAGVAPTRRCDRLTPAQWTAVAESASHILHEAIRYEGSTLGDGTYRNALNGEGGYQAHHRVYDREGELCRACGRGKIVRIVQCQRSTFFCPICQSARGTVRPKKR